MYIHLGHTNGDFRKVSWNSIHKQKSCLPKAGNAASFIEKDLYRHICIYILNVSTKGLFRASGYLRFLKFFIKQLVNFWKKMKILIDVQVRNEGWRFYSSNSFTPMMWPHFIHNVHKCQSLIERYIKRVKHDLSIIIQTVFYRGWRSPT